MDDQTRKSIPLRTERLSKVFVTGETRDEMRAMLAAEGKTIGPGNVAGLVLEEARRLGLLRIIWKVQDLRYRGGSDKACRELFAELTGKSNL